MRIQNVDPRVRDRPPDGNRASLPYCFNRKVGRKGGSFGWAVNMHQSVFRRCLQRLPNALGIACLPTKKNLVHSMKDVGLYAYAFVKERSCQEKGRDLQIL